MIAGERWNHWCRVCRQTLPLAEETWHVTLTGRVTVNGDCAECGNPLMSRFVRAEDAPPDVAATAVAVDRTYRHYQKAYTNRRNVALERLTHGVRVDDKLVRRLAWAFGVQPQHVWRLIRGG